VLLCALGVCRSTCRAQLCSLLHVQLNFEDACRRWYNAQNRSSAGEFWKLCCVVPVVIFQRRGCQRLEKPLKLPKTSYVDLQKRLTDATRLSRGHHFELLPLVCCECRCKLLRVRMGQTRNLYNESESLQSSSRKRGCPRRR
jgi:hypothetical protein